MDGIAYATPLLALRATVFDSETTSLDARKARVVQIGCVRLAQGQIDDGETLDRLVNPGGAIPAATTAVHGITNEMVASAPSFPAIASELEAFAANSIIIGHTISYDVEVLKSEYALASRAWPGWHALDVRFLARLAAPSLADHSLDRLCEWLGITIVGRHSALGDARATAEVFVKLLPLLRSRGIRTLGEADQASAMLAERDSRAGGGLMLVTGTGTQVDTQPLMRLDSFPYRHRMRDVMSHPAISIDAAAPVREAIALLIERHISSALVKLEDGVTGIVTERDLLRAVHTGGPTVFAAPVGNFASKPLQTVAADAFVYRAIGRMERVGFRHLGVRGADGEIVGIVTTRNLLRNRSTTAIVLGDEIEAAPDAAGLAAAWGKVPRMARGLIDEGVDARNICAVISSEIRNMTRRAAQIAEERMAADGFGIPPTSYAVLVLGSAGRGESQLAADQDNAIVYADGEEGGTNDTYFAKLATVMNEILDAAGIEFCKGGVMAKNRAWRMSAADWRAKIDHWIGRHRPEDLLNVDIFFDAVGVHGDMALADGIWEHAFDRGHRTIDFTKLLAMSARRRGQPFTILGKFRVDEKGRIDLKKFGLMPIFTSARVLAIRHDVRRRSTPERLEGTADKGIGSPEVIQAIIAAQDTMLRAVIEQQLLDLAAGVPLTPFVEPGRMSKARRAALKTSLAQVDEAIGMVAEGLI